MKKRKKIVNRLIAFVLGAAFVLAGIPGFRAPAEAGTVSAGTITVAVERFSIGQGYLIEPYITTYQSGDTYEDVCRRVLKENGYSFDSKGSDFYLSGISGADGGKISIPSCIQKIGAKKIGVKNVDPPDNSAVNEYAGKNAWLGEFSYSKMAGWMYSVGNDGGYEFSGVGMDGRSPKNGDVFRLQFSVWGYGEDLTGCGQSDKTKIYYPVGDKTVLTGKIAQVNQNKTAWFSVEGCEAAYQNALKVLQKLDATQKELDDALAQLPSEEEVFPDKEITQDPAHTDSEEEAQAPTADNAVKLKKSVNQVMKETSKYILSMDKNPTLGSEWFVLGLARSGKSLKSKYFETYYNHIANYLEENDGKLTNSAKYTEYSKQILVMTAIGRDARNIAGYNLLENLADFNKITEQGFNGAVWALIALNSNPDYTIPKVSGVSEQTTEKKLIRYLLKGEISGGGWSLQGEEPDVDITAMTLQALAPYYQKKGYEKVTAAVDRGVKRLSKMQLKTGGFSTMGVESLESNAQVITALCALGIDPKKDSRFIKNGKWTVENLISYHVKDSGFVHVKSGNTAKKTEVNGMATGQGYYALVAYQRFREGKTSLYDMSDLTVQKGEKGDGTGTGMEDPEENQSKGNSNSKTTGKRAGQTLKKSSGKKADAETEAGGWSFSGKTYVPDSAALTDTETEAGEGSEKEISGESAESDVPEGWFSGSVGSYIVVFVLGAVFGAGIVFITGRRKQNEKKN